MLLFEYPVGVGFQRRICGLEQLQRRWMDGWIGLDLSGLDLEIGG